jgi:hypothetical protein
MSYRVSDYWNTLLSSSIVQEHSFYDMSALDKIPEAPGLYAWYLVVNNHNISEYYKIFKQKKVKVSIEGSLKEAYEGEVRNIYYEEDFKTPVIDHDLCAVASLAFSPPLYIGISKSLRTRLKQHAEELTKIYYGKVALSTPPPLGKTEFDTIHESSHFAQRIGFTIKNHLTVNLTSLRIKTLEMPPGYHWQDLQRVEKYINRTFIPMYGRK